MSPHPAEYPAGNRRVIYVYDRHRDGRRGSDKRRNPRVSCSMHVDGSAGDKSDRNDCRDGLGARPHGNSRGGRWGAPALADEPLTPQPMTPRVRRFGLALGDRDRARASTHVPSAL